VASEPIVVDRAEQPYVAVSSNVAMDNIVSIATRHPEVFSWLSAHGLTPAGPPFLRYVTIDMATTLEIEAGVPVSAQVETDGAVIAGVLPAGRYATSTHVGHPDGLMAATGDLMRWAEERALTWDVSDTPAGERWGARLEVYRTDPAEAPDMTTWETDLVFRLSD
jgi:effector-binding domain-containing protein